MNRFQSETTSPRDICRWGGFDDARCDVVISTNQQAVIEPPGVVFIHESSSSGTDATNYYYNNSNNLDGAANGDTMNVTASAVLSASRTLNALKINGSGLSITSTSGAAQFSKARTASMPR